MSRKSHKLKKYSAELKLKAVQEYLNGEGSLWDICLKNNIKNEKSLREWILMYDTYGIPLGCGSVKNPPCCSAGWISTKS